MSAADFLESCFSQERMNRCEKAQLLCFLAISDAINAVEKNNMSAFVMALSQLGIAYKYFFGDHNSLEIEHAVGTMWRFGGPGSKSKQRLLDFRAQSADLKYFIPFMPKDPLVTNGLFGGVFSHEESAEDGDDETLSEMRLFLPLIAALATEHLAGGSDGDSNLEKRNADFVLCVSAFLEKNLAGVDHFRRFIIPKTVSSAMPTISLSESGPEHYINLEQRGLFFSSLVAGFEMWLHVLQVSDVNLELQSFVDRQTTTERIGAELDAAGDAAYTTSQIKSWREEFAKVLAVIPEIRAQDRYCRRYAWVDETRRRRDERDEEYAAKFSQTPAGKWMATLEQVGADLDSKKTSLSRRRDEWEKIRGGYEELRKLGDDELAKMLTEAKMQPKKLKKSPAELDAEGEIKKLDLKIKTIESGSKVVKTAKVEASLSRVYPQLQHPVNLLSTATRVKKKLIKALSPLEPLEAEKDFLDKVRKSLVDFCSWVWYWGNEKALKAGAYSTQETKTQVMERFGQFRTKCQEKVGAKCQDRKLNKAVARQRRAFLDRPHV